MKKKVTNYVDSMEKKLSILQKDLDAISNPAKTRSDDETTSQKYDLAEKTEVTKEELSKLK